MVCVLVKVYGLGVCIYNVDRIILAKEYSLFQVKLSTIGQRYGKSSADKPPIHISAGRKKRTQLSNENSFSMRILIPPSELDSKQINRVQCAMQLVVSSNKFPTSYY